MSLKGVEERRVFEIYLCKKGKKMTAARAVLLEAFLQLDRHTTAGELFEAARRVDPRIGQATAFRTIKLLAKAGLARGACPDEGARRYERAYRQVHHDHLVCVGCGAVTEFQNESIEKAQQAIYRAHGYVPSGHRLELQGYCPSCSRKRKAAG